MIKNGDKIVINDKCTSVRKNIIFEIKSNPYYSVINGFGPFCIIDEEINGICFSPEHWIKQK